MMNYSDYDSEDYSSNEDEDYVPSDDNLSEDDLNECEPEDGLEGEGQGEPQSEATNKKKKKKGKDITARKRKKVALKLEGEEEDGAKHQEEEKEAEEEEEVSAEPDRQEEKHKKKADDLWASFLSDVGQRPKASTAQTSTSTSQKPASTDSSDKKIPSDAQQETPKEKAPSKITITKVFDFAGEEVRVTKEVAADSKEAKSYLKKEADPERAPPSPSGVTAPAPGPRYASSPNHTPP
ncbi:hypothetical protein ACEWY4_011434 [Coilia grayii]|uniref:Craniofacial development protein 1 n=1 Tax=Coilia grayii TaxID=363190 RepID=A0ABD1K4S8_9TELE